MLDDLHKLIYEVSQKLGLDKNLIDDLVNPNAEHVFDIELENGKVFKAFRIQHNNKRGVYKGGIRFHENVSQEEVKALSTLMSLKTAAVGLPLGGGKGGVAVNPKNLSKEELEELSRKYVDHLKEFIGPDQDVPAPDVNTNATIIDWMVDEYQKLTGDESNASFTGKSIAKGGSLGRNEATGRGGVIAFTELLELQGKSGQELTYAVQGFGNVGQFFAKVAQKEHQNLKLAAVSDSSATIAAQDLDADELAEFKNNGGRFYDYDKQRVDLMGPEEIVGLEVDVLVLAALEDAVFKDNMHSIKAKYIIEMANGPISNEAYNYLAGNGVVILPDVVANAGGVIVSYLEWFQNKQAEKWSEDKVNQELEKYMTNAVRDIYKLSQNKNVPLKEAAFMSALKNLTI